MAITTEELIEIERLLAADSDGMGPFVQLRRGRGVMREFDTQRGRPGSHWPKECWAVSNEPAEYGAVLCKPTDDVLERCRMVEQCYDAHLQSREGVPLRYSKSTTLQSSLSGVSS
ncbi:hypothetical protein [Bradyrhizobium barranii]